DEDGNTVSKSDMVAGKTYSVKATLKPEYAANFEFIDVNGVVLPDATASTSHEFDYSTGDNDGDNDNNGSSNNGGGNVPDDYYKWYKVHVIFEGAAVAVMSGIFIMFIVLMFRFRNKKKAKSDDRHADTPDSGAGDSGRDDL
ncbi:MAG: hypothetical protein HFH71_04480, partial [Clostridia bacterium]|nr:hypothetical protein [Clostridia bacterium]